MTRRRDGLVQIALVLAAVLAYELARRLNAPNWPLAERHAREVLALERAVHAEWEETLQRAFLRAPTIVQAMNVFYVTAHFVVTGAFFVWLYHRAPAGFRHYRNAFLVATGLSLLAHWGFPTAPPRLAGVGLEDTLRRFSHLDIGSRETSAFSNPVAAVPSLHVGWAVGVGAGLVRYARSLGWRAAGAVYPPAVVLVVVVTGNHFLFDSAAGTAVMVLGFWVSGVLPGRDGGTLRVATRGGAVR